MLKGPFLLHVTTEVGVFANPSSVSQAPHTSEIGKYLLEGETSLLGNGSMLIVALL